MTIAHSLLCLLILLATTSPPFVYSATATGLQQRYPIAIYSDSSFTTANGITSGSGTASDPYMIDGWQIDASTVRTQYGVAVYNTTRYFVIRNVLVFSAFRGIYFQNVTNGRIESSTVRDSSLGIDVENSTNTSIVSNTLLDTHDANGSGGYCQPTYGVPRCADAKIYVKNSKGISVVGNTATSYLRSQLVLDGLVIISSPGSIVSNNTVLFSSYGIYLHNSDGSALTGNNASFNQVWAIQSGQDSNVTGNFVYGNGNGIAAGSGLVENNLVEANQGVGIDWAGNGTLSGNRVDYNGIGIDVLTSSSSNVVTDNDVMLNGQGIQVASCGTYSFDQFFGEDTGTFCKSTNARISNNKIAYNSQFGLSIGAGQTQVAGNNFTGDGLILLAPRPTRASYVNAEVRSFLGNSSSLSITPDNLVNGKPLIYYANCSNLDVNGITAGEAIVLGCRNLRISNLQIYQANIGIQMIDLNDTLITGNMVNSNSETGIKIDFYSNVTISGNNLSNNGGGRNVEANGFEATSFSLQNTPMGLQAYHNNYVDDNALGPYRFQETCGYPCGGNYWWPAVLSSVDNCSGPNQDICPKPDGIADFGGSDPYPLLRPYLSSPDASPPTWLPNQPFVARDVSQNSATLVWLRAADDLGVTKYLVYRDSNLVANVSADSLQPVDFYAPQRPYVYQCACMGYSYTVTGLASGTTYTFKIVAVDLAENQSKPSQSLTLSTLSGWGITQDVEIGIGVAAIGTVIVLALFLRKRRGVLFFRRSKPPQEINPKATSLGRQAISPRTCY